VVGAAVEADGGGDGNDEETALADFVVDLAWLSVKDMCWP
jgi:hypothetical protein